VAKRAHVRLATRLRRQSAFFNSADVDTCKLERSGKVVLVLVIYLGKEVHVLGGSVEPGCSSCRPSSTKVARTAENRPV